MYSVPPGLPLIAPPGTGNPPIKPQIPEGGEIPPTRFGGPGVPPGQWDIQTYSAGHQWGGTHQSRAEGEWGAAIVSADGAVSYREDPAKIAQHPGDVTSTSTVTGGSSAQGAINPGGHMLTNNGAFNGKAWWKVVTETGDVQTYSVETRSHSELYDIFYNGQYYGTYMISADTRTEHVSGSRTWVGHQQHVGNLHHGHWETAPDQDILHLDNPVINKLTGGDLSLTGPDSSDPEDRSLGQGADSVVQVELDVDPGAAEALATVGFLDSDGETEELPGHTASQADHPSLVEVGGVDQLESPSALAGSDGQPGAEPPPPDLLQQAVQVALDESGQEQVVSVPAPQGLPDPDRLQGALQEWLEPQSAAGDPPPFGDGGDPQQAAPGATAQPPPSDQVEAAAQAVLNPDFASGDPVSPSVGEGIPNSGAGTDDSAKVDPDQTLAAPDGAGAGWSESLPPEVNADDDLPPVF